MGKESLLKPTSKKSAAAGKKATAAKKTTSTKKSPKAKPQTAPKKSPAVKKTASKTAKTPKAKTVAKAAKPKTTARKAKGPARTKKLTAKQLLLKKFDGWEPAELYRPETVERTSVGVSATASASRDDSPEIARMRKLLFKKFDLSAPETTEAGPVTEADAPPPISPPPIIEKQTDPMARVIKFALIGLALLIALVIKVSDTNRSHYYIKPAKTGVEIWRGIFAPMGQERLLKLDDAQAPASISPVYSKNEVYPFVFDHYMKNADRLLEKPGMPDFEMIKANLNEAMPFAVTEKHRTLATARLNSIDQMILLIKADAAAGKDTIADYDAALDYLKQAETLDVDGSKSALIQKKTAAVTSAKAALEQKLETEKKAAEKATPPGK